MKDNKVLFHITILLLLVVLASTSCTFKIVDLDAMETAIPATLTAVPSTQKVALLSFHGRYVTAMGGGGGWLLKQEPDLSDCGWFTLHHLDNGKVALMTCHDRYVTAPKTGATRSDWMLWQESERGDCGEFVLHDLGRDGVALETCVGRFVTAGDGNWPGELAWSLVGETYDILAWEMFTVLQPYTPPPPVIANFDSCTGATKLGGQMGTAYDPKSDDTIVVSYVQEAGRGCIARLEYDIVGWSAFWIQLQGADLSPYSQLVFDVKADPQKVPERVKIELKRAGGQEVSILYLSGITTDWQTMSVNLRDFEGSLSSFTDMEELVFTFEANESGRIGVIYLDNIALRRAWGNQ